MPRKFVKIFPFFLFLLACIGVGLNLYATTWGAALSDDSFFYVKPARDILANLPYELNAHFPPALPFLLAGIGKLTGLDPLRGIRFLNAFCFGLNIFLAGLLVSKASKSLWIGSAAALFVLLAQPAIEVHAWAMSEALFISLVLSSFLVAAQYLETRRIGWFALSVVLAALTALTRYAGMALIAATCLVFLIYPGRSWKRRVIEPIVFGALAVGLFAIYLFSRSIVSTEFSSVGGLHFGPIGNDDLTDLLYNSLLWLMPGRLARGHETLVAGAIGGLLLLGLLIAVGESHVPGCSFYLSFLPASIFSALPQRSTFTTKKGWDSHLATGITPNCSISSHQLTPKQSWSPPRRMGFTLLPTA